LRDGFPVAFRWGRKGEPERSWLRRGGTAAAVRQLRSAATSSPATAAMWAQHAGG